MQNAAARLMTKSKTRDHVTPILTELLWLTIDTYIHMQCSFCLRSYEFQELARLKNRVPTWVPWVPQIHRWINSEVNFIIIKLLFSVLLDCFLLHPPPLGKSKHCATPLSTAAVNSIVGLCNYYMYTSAYHCMLINIKEKKKGSNVDQLSPESNFINIVF